MLELDGDNSFVKIRASMKNLEHVFKFMDGPHNNVTGFEITESTSLDVYGNALDAYGKKYDKDTPEIPTLILYRWKPTETPKNYNPFIVTSPISSTTELVRKWLMDNMCDAADKDADIDGSLGRGFLLESGWFNISKMCWALTIQPAMIFHGK